MSNHSLYVFSIFWNHILLLRIHVAPGKGLLSSEKHLYFSYFSKKTYVVGTHKKRPSEALLMSTHNICSYGELKKNIP